MSDQEVSSFKKIVSELREKFANDPQAAKLFFEQANRWTVPTWEDDPELVKRLGVKLQPSIK